MKRFSTFAILLAFSVTAASATRHQANADDVTITITKKDNEKETKPPFTGTRPAVDVAILLDTSNSMDGLIAQAKSQLWNIVQQFADAKKVGKTPNLRVSVFEYGNTNLPASEGFIRQVVQLTDDMDKVSEVLFALKTHGGDEYCGQVIEQAIKRLDWSGEPNSYKAIFIAGNEPFTQGSVNYKESCRSAIEHGIVINTIHCGDYQTGINTHWKDGADLAEGSYLNINQDRKIVHIDCPQDKIIIKLNDQLNKTYLWFGSREVRLSYSDNQIAQDRNALSVGGSGGFGGGRGAAKASPLYRNAGRDLVDTLEEDRKILSKLNNDQLPKEMQAMSAAQRQAHVDKMAAKRAEIKKQIGQLSREREAFAAEKRKEISVEDGDDTLGAVISIAIRQQLLKSGFDLQQ
jgi:hypothetical protein